jgi:hypothetical protein
MLCSLDASPRQCSTPLLISTETPNSLCWHGSTVARPLICIRCLVHVIKIMPSRLLVERGRYHGFIFNTVATDRISKVRSLCNVCFTPVGMSTVKKSGFHIQLVQGIFLFSTAT